MKTQSIARHVSCVTVLLTVAAATALYAEPAGTTFTYQGRLTQNGSAANGTYDFQFLLYDAAVGGSQVGPIVDKADVMVTGGIFTVLLDFGAVFRGPARYLDIAVRPGDSSGLYTPLVPRQRLTAAPAAISLVMPYHADVDSGTDALSITNIGEGGVADFRSRSTFASAFVKNDGDGSALRADTGSNGSGNAVTGLNYGPEGYAGSFQLNNADNPRAGLYARTRGTGSAADLEVNVDTRADALYARTTSSDSGSYAGYFQGNVMINGTLSKSAGSFKIDHPLDPADKYLYHSFVESPDMMNVYNGTVVLDANGEAVVVLPDWFEALNRDYRYQLTAIGAPGPNLFVAEEIQGNEFKIAGGGPGLKVSWQVTGIRHDAYANAHRIPVEEVKPVEEQGTFLHPEVHGQPRTRSLDLLEHPLSPETPSELRR